MICPHEIREAIGGSGKTVTENELLGARESEISEQERKKEEKLIFDEQPISDRHCAGNLHVTLLHLLKNS